MTMGLSDWSKMEEKSIGGQGVQELRDQFIRTV